MLLLVLSFLMSFAASKKALIATDTFNNGVNLFNDCDTYNDCYNCTLAKCSWSGSACDNPAGSTSPAAELTVSAFLVEARKCGDPEGICGFHLDKKTADVELFFTDKAKYLPPNYFCTYNLQEHKKSWVRYLVSVN